MKLLVFLAFFQQKETLVVTGQFEPVATEEADRPVRRIEVRGEQSLVSNTVTDFLNRDSSIDLRQRGQSNIQTDISIRGGTFGQTLVLLDGMRLNDVQSGHHNADLPVPLEAVERIEVLKGSGSTFYGSDAVGGVVHILTKTPETSEFRLRTALGNFGTNQQRATGTLVRKWFSEQLSASRDFSSGFIPNRDFRNLALASLTRLDKTEIVLGHADKPFGAEQFYGNYNSWERTKTWFAAARQPLGERMTASFAYRRHTDLFVLYRDRPEVFTNRHTSESWQGALRRWEPLGRNTRLHYGVEGLGESVESTNLGSHSRARVAGYAALDVRALKRYSFSAGIRDELHHAISPTVAAGAWLNSRVKVRASASRAFRLPSYTDLYYHDPANLGSPDLRPERATSFEGGLDVNSGGHVRGEVTVFQRRETDGIDYVRRSVNDIWRATNFQRLRFTGVEASISARTPYGLVDFSYTGLHGVQNVVEVMSSKYAFNYPTHLGVAGWQRELPGRLLARVRVGAIQRIGRDPYGVLDVYLARVKGRISPFVQATNLTGSMYQEILGVRMPGRGILGGVEVRVR
jgi:iron complex outermembrane receptor protein